MYPSITETLLKESLRWEKDLGVEITEKEIEVILHCRQSYLIYDGEEWEKSHNSAFGIGHGSYDGAEACELCDLLILDKIVKQSIIPKENITAYRDDFLALLGNDKNENERTRKKVIKRFM